MPTIYPTINGVRFDYSSLEIVIMARPGAVARFGGVKSLSYTGKLEPGKGYGTSAQKRIRTRGQYDASGSMEIYKSEWRDLLALLSAGGKGFMEQAFDIVANYSEFDAPDVITDTAVGCRITSHEDSPQEGSDPLVVKCDLDIMYVLPGGFRPLTTLLP